MSWSIRIDGHIPAGPGQRDAECELVQAIGHALATKPGAVHSGRFDGDAVTGTFGSDGSVTVQLKPAEPSVHKRGAPEHPLTGT